MTIGEIIKNKQPNIYYKLINFSNSNKDNTNYKKLMEDAPVFKRHRGAWRQVRHE